MCPITASDIMSKRVVAVSEDTTLRDTVGRMLERNVGCAVIVDDEGRCVGVITERDCLRLFHQNVLPLSRVGEYMTRNPITVREEASINEAKNIMISQRIRHLPVVNKKGQVVGILSMRDIFERVETLI